MCGSNIPINWRLTALSCAGGVLSTLVAAAEDSARSSGNGLMSPAYSRALKCLNEGDYLVRILDVCLGGRREFLWQFDDQEFGSDEIKRQHSNHLLESMLTLCVPLACSVEGVDSLVEGGIFGRLSHLTHLSTPFHASNVANNQTSEEESRVTLETHFLAILRVLQSMLITSPKDKLVVEGSLRFFQQNHATVSYYLQLRSFSLTGLQIAGSLLSVLGMTMLPVFDNSATPSSLATHKKLRSSVARDDEAGSLFSHSQQTPLFDEVLDHLADSFTKDICWLLHFIGISCTL